jgi:hypothetical protein
MFIRFRSMTLTVLLASCLASPAFAQTAPSAMPDNGISHNSMSSGSSMAHSNSKKAAGAMDDSMGHNMMSPAATPGNGMSHNTMAPDSMSSGTMSKSQ